MFIFAGLAYLAFVVFTVRTLEKRDIQPYLLAYAVVLGSGVWSFFGFQSALESGLELSTLLASYIFSHVAAGVTGWGLARLYRMQLKSSTVDEY